MYASQIKEKLGASICGQIKNEFNPLASMTVSPQAKHALCFWLTRYYIVVVYRFYFLMVFGKTSKIFFDMTLYLYQMGTQGAGVWVEVYGVWRTKEKQWKTLILKGKDLFSLFKVQSLASCYFLGNWIRVFERWLCQLLGDSGREKSGAGSWSRLGKDGLRTQRDGRISS